jgi:Pao retrotransposon peptidase
MPKLLFKRWTETLQGIHIVAFSDALQEAIGFCVYIYAKDSGHGNLLYSRSRLSQKGKTIPELEFRALAWMISDVYLPLKKMISINGSTDQS